MMCLDKKGGFTLTKEIMLNNRLFQVNSYKEERVNDARIISVEFFVTSEEYHEVTTLLYKNHFDVVVPEENLSFEAVIEQYSTSLTNLYKENQVSTFSLSLHEVKK